MKNKGLKILLSVLLVLCIIMAGALIGKEYIGDNIKEAANQNGVDVVKDTSNAGKAEDNAVDSTAEGKESTQSDAAKAEATEADKQQPQMSTIVITATGDCTLGNNQEQSYDGSFNSYYDSKGHIVKLVVHAKHIVSIPDKVKCFRKLMIDFLLLLDELERLHEGFFRYHFSPSSSLAFISHAMASSCVSGSTSHSRKRTINRSTVHPRGVMISLI